MAADKNNFVDMGSGDAWRVLLMLAVPLHAVDVLSEPIRSLMASHRHDTEKDGGNYSAGRIKTVKNIWRRIF